MRRTQRIAAWLAYFAAAYLLVRMGWEGGWWGWTAVMILMALWGGTTWQMGRWVDESAERVEFYERHLAALWRDVRSAMDEHGPITDITFHPDREDTDGPS